MDLTIFVGKFLAEREEGVTPRENEKISDNVWGGIQALIQARILDGWFERVGILQILTSCPS